MDHRADLDESTYPDDGGRPSQRGIIFQLNLLILFLLRAQKNKYNSFRIATEFPEAEKFDDVVLQYQRKEDDNWKFRLLQAKHSKHKIKENDLLSTSDDNFSLQKYFHSYMKIKRKCQKEESSIYSVFAESEIEDVIICTNTDFNSDDLKSSFTPISLEQDEVLKIDDCNITTKAAICKLEEGKGNRIVEHLKSSIIETSDFTILVDKLADCITNNKEIDNIDIFKYYYYPLVTKVLDINSCKLSNHFLENTSCDELEFRNDLLREIIFRVQYENKKLKVSKEFGRNHHHRDFEKIASDLASKTELDPVDFKDSHIWLVENKVINKKTGKFYANFLTNKSITELRNHILKKMTLKKINNKIFQISQNFGENELPNNYEELKDLAVKLAKYIKENKELTPQEFKNYHEALTKTVIDKENSKFKQIFLNKNSDKTILTGVSKIFRSIFLKELIDTSPDAIKISETFQKLKLKKIKLSSKFKAIFTPDEHFNIDNIEQFVQQLKIIFNNHDDFNVFINDSVTEKENFEIFKKNINKLKGYVLIKKSGIIRISTSFLDTGNYLPGNLKDFRDNLKNNLGDSFKLLYKYKFNIEFSKDKQIKGETFRTCEEGVVHRKLPKLLTEEDFAEFLSKLKFVVNYPNYKEIKELLKKDILDILKTLDGTFINSFYVEYMQTWMANEVGTFLTAEKAETLFKKINDELAMTELNSGFDSISIDCVFKEYTEVCNFLESNTKQVLHLTVQNLVLGHTRIAQTLKTLKQKHSNQLRIYIYESGNIYSKLQSVLSDDKILKCFKSVEKGNLLLIECDDITLRCTEVEILFNQLKSILEANSKKKIIFLSQQNDIIGNRFAKETNMYYQKEFETRFIDLTVEAQNKILEEAKITFQGDEVKLGELIDDKSKDIIDSEVLHQIINKDKIEIGKKRPHLSDLDSLYYIPGVKITEKQLCNALRNNTTDLFVICGSTETEFLNVFVKVTDEKRVMEKSRARKQFKFVTEKNEENILESYKQTCRENKGITHLIEMNGKNLTWRRSYDASFYIDRQLNQIVIDGNCFIEKTDEQENTSIEETKKNDIFVVSSTKVNKFKKQYSIEVSKIEDITILLTKNHIVILNSVVDEKKFSKFCSQYKLEDKYNIHWLNYKNAELIWRRSIGQINTLQENRCITNDSFIENKDINEIISKEKAIVIAGDPGMGKTTQLTHMLGEPRKSEWIIKISLIKYQEELVKLKSLNENKNNSDNLAIIIDFFSSIGVVRGQLAKNLLRYRIEHEGKVTLLMDGYDEISQENQKNVIKLLVLLKNTQTKIQITTRLHVKHHLEEAFSVLSYTFQPFSADNQKQFLKRFWKTSIQLLDDKIDDKTLEKNVKIIFDNFSANINDKKYKFLNVPLITRMFAEVYIVGESVLSINQSEKKVIDEIKSLSIYSLYEKFIDKKYEIYFKDKLRITHNIDYLKNILTKAFNRDHQRLAFYKLYSTLETSELFDTSKLLSREEERDLKMVGIIQSIGIKNDAYFIHQTFAEYFAACLLVKKLKKKQEIAKFKILHTFIQKNICSSRGKVVCKFIEDDLYKEDDRDLILKWETILFDAWSNKINSEYIIPLTGDSVHMLNKRQPLQTDVEVLKINVITFVNQTLEHTGAKKLADKTYQVTRNYLIEAKQQNKLDSNFFIENVCKNLMKKFDLFKQYFILRPRFDENEKNNYLKKISVLYENLENCEYLEDLKWFLLFTEFFREDIASDFQKRVANKVDLLYNSRSTTWLEGKGISISIKLLILTPSICKKFKSILDDDHVTGSEKNYAFNMLTSLIIPMIDIIRQKLPNFHEEEWLEMFLHFMRPFILTHDTTYFINSNFQRLSLILNMIIFKISEKIKEKPSPIIHKIEYLKLLTYFIYIFVMKRMPVSLTFIELKPIFYLIEEVLNEKPSPRFGSLECSKLLFLLDNFDLIFNIGHQFLISYPKGQNKYVLSIPSEKKDELAMYLEKRFSY